MGNSYSAKINYYFSNLNLIIILIGYPLIVTIFIPILGISEGSTRIVTIPFRVLAFAIAIITLFINIRKKIIVPKALKLFLLFWGLLLLRMFYDLEIRTDYITPTIYKQQVWSFAVAICFIPMLSIIKSFNKIDFKFILKYMFVLGNFILIIIFFSVSKESLEKVRLGSNVALDPISYSILVYSTTIITIYRFITEKRKSKITKIKYIFFTFLGILVGLRSGSRGPLLAFLVVFVVWYLFGSNKKRIKYFNLFSVIIIIFFSISGILKTISAISPLAAFRIVDTFSGNDMSILNREESYLWFFNKILDSPLWGSQFARLSDYKYPGYAHNVFLDILLGMGILGLGLFLYIIKKVFVAIKVNVKIKKHYWIGLLMILYFIVSLSSGAYYSNPQLNILIVLTLMLYSNDYIKSIV